MTKSVFKRFMATIALALSCVVALALPGLASAQTLTYGTLSLNVPEGAEISELDTSAIAADEATVQETMAMLQQAGVEMDEAELATVLDVISQSSITAVEASNEVDYVIYLPASVVAEQMGLDVNELAGIDEESWASFADDMTSDMDELTSVLPGAAVDAYSSIENGNPIAGLTFGNIAVNGIGYQLEVAVAFIPGDLDPGMLICLGVSTTDGSDLGSDILVVHEADDAIEFGGGTLTAPAGSMSIHVDIWGLEFLVIMGDDGVAFATDINSPAIASEMGITADDIIASFDEVFSDAPEGIAYQGAVQDGIAVFQIDMTGEVLQMLVGALADEVAAGDADVEIPGLTAEDLQAALSEVSQSEMPDLTLQGLLGIDAEQVQAFLGIGATGGQTVAAIMA